VASLMQNKSTGRFYVRFRYAGASYKRSLKTNSPHVAEAALARLEDTLQLVQLGRITIPDDADPATFLLTDGKKSDQPGPEEVRTLGELCDAYLAALPEGTKEATTLQGEAIHRRHLLRILKKRSSLKTFSQRILQYYINQRLGESYRGKPIRPATIKKEITTLRLMWNWAKDECIVTTGLPTRRLSYPKLDEKPPFMTWAEIEQTIRLHHLDEEATKELWESLFLTRDEVEDFLDHVQQSKLHEFVYPQLVFVAHTGVRRSEMMRSQLNDFDMVRQLVRIREKKKSRKHAISFRSVPMSQRLRAAIQEWIPNHSGGTHSFCTALAEPLTSGTARTYFKQAVRGSKWQNVRGFHVFRHSFASNLAAAGVDERTIDEFMGHQTEQMRKRYRHLFPDQMHSAIDSVFGDGTGRATVNIAG
jgi:integrase